MQTELRECFAAALEAAFGDRVRGMDPLIKQSADPKFGDYQCNIAMSLAKQLAMKPREVADRLVEGVQQVLARGTPWFFVQIDGPGFVNIRLRREYLEELLQAIPMEPADDRLGLTPVSGTEQQTVVVDYSSPNVAKEMHVGHLRSTIIGDTICRVLAFQGHEVVRQNHLGDWGTQFGMIILGMWHIYAGRRRGEPDDWLVRQTRELNAAASDKAKLDLLASMFALQEEGLRDDPNGTAFEQFLRDFVPTLELLQSAYRFVNAVESAAEKTGFDRTADGKKIPMAAVSNHVVRMLQEGGERNRQERAAWRLSVRSSLSATNEIYHRLGVLLVDADIRGESFYHELLAGVVEELKLALATPSGEGDVRAVCRIDQGAVCVFHQRADGTPMFKGPQGDPLPMIIQKSDGAFLYATTDLAAAIFRISHAKRNPARLLSRSLSDALAAKGGGLGADRIAYVVGGPQKLHLQMFFTTVDALGWKNRTGRAAVSMEHVAFGSVLGDDRRPLKTRSGENVRLKDLLDEAERRARALIDENDSKRNELGLDPLSDAEKKDIAHAVGIGAVKYADLSQNRNTDYVFSWEKMLALQGNTAPYLMYAYARIRSIHRKASAALNVPVASGAISLTDPAEIALAKRILQFPETLAIVADGLLPNVLCEYLYELASAFMRFYENCPVLQAPDDRTRASRVRLCDLTARTLRIGLELLGIRALERM